MGLRTKLLLPIVFAFGIFALAVHFYWAPDMLAYEKSTVVEREHEVLKALTPGLVRSLLKSDLGAIYVTLDRQMESKSGSWRQVTLTDLQDNRLYPLTEPNILAGENLISLEHTLSWEQRKIANIHLVLDWSQEKAEYLRRIDFHMPFARESTTITGFQKPFVKKLPGIG